MMMHIQEAILTASKNLPKRAAFAYNVNIDAVKILTGSEMPQVLPDEIRDLPECIERGAEEEVSVSKGTLDFLLKKFGKFELGIGGQAGNMALVAARLGVTSFVHSASKAREQMRLLDEPNVLVAAEKKGGFVRPSKIKQNRGHHPSVHVVLEFRKGNHVGKKMRIGGSNRYIATYDPFNSEMRADRDFEREIRKVMPKTDKAIVSGFQLLSRGNVRETIEKKREQLREWKRLNPNLGIHFEFGDFHKNGRGVLRRVMRKILPLCDSVGFNEFEVQQAACALGLGKTGGEIATAIKVLSAMKKADTVVLHSTRYAFAASRSVGGRKLLNSLVFGAASAAYMASTGKRPSLHELARFSRGLSRGKARASRSAGFNTARVNSFFVERPRRTVGLGDCFTAGYFLTLPAEGMQ